MANEQHNGPINRREVQRPASATGYVEHLRGANGRMREYVRTSDADALVSRIQRAMNGGHSDAAD